MNAGIWFWELATNHVEWSDSLLAAYGVTRGDWGGTFADWFTRVHPEDQPRLTAALQAHLERREPYHIERFRMRHSSGEYRWFATDGQATWDAAGAAVRMAGAVRDITNQKQADESNAQLAMASAILARSIDYQATLANVARAMVPAVADWCAIDILEHGTVRRLAVEHPDPALIALAYELDRRYPPDPASPYSVQHVLRTGEPAMLAQVPDELFVRGAVNAEHLAMLRALQLGSFIIVPMRGHDRALGAISLVRSRERPFTQGDLGFARELAQRASVALENALLYEQVRAAREAAETANRMKDEFLAVVSHELRTPLNAILGWAQLLAAGPPDPVRTAKGLATIERNAQAQARLIEDILDLSRIVTGKLQLRLAPVPVAGFVGAALDAVRPAAAAKQLDLGAAVEPDLEMVGDADRLQQIVWNLLANAVKFTPTGGSVTVTAARTGDTLSITVSDTGPGIAAAFLPHVFERFRQADSTASRSHGGLGLGLAIVRHLVELHGGDVSAASAGPGQGATFTLRFPCATLVAPGVPVAPALEVSSSTGPRGLEIGELGGIHVLLVEDDQDTRELLTLFLQQLGARVSAAADVAHAVELLAVSPDVIVSDIGMPEVDGYSFMRRVRAQAAGAGGTTPAIALTAYARELDRAAAAAAGFQRHLAKPVVTRELVEAIRGLVGR